MSFDVLTSFYPQSDVSNGLLEANTKYAGIALAVEAIGAAIALSVLHAQAKVLLKAPEASGSSRLVERLDSFAADLRNLTDRTSHGSSNAITRGSIAGFGFQNSFVTAHEFPIGRGIQLTEHRSAEVGSARLRNIGYDLDWPLTYPFRDVHF